MISVESPKLSLYDAIALGEVEQTVDAGPQVFPYLLRILEHGVVDVGLEERVCRYAEADALEELNATAVTKGLSKLQKWPEGLSTEEVLSEYQVTDKVLADLVRLVRDGSEVETTTQWARTAACWMPYVPLLDYPSVTRALCQTAGNASVIQTLAANEPLPGILRACRDTPHGSAALKQLAQLSPKVARQIAIQNPELRSVLVGQVDDPLLVSLWLQDGSLERMSDDSEVLLDRALLRLMVQSPQSSVPLESIREWNDAARWIAMAQTFREGNDVDRRLEILRNWRVPTGNPAALVRHHLGMDALPDDFRRLLDRAREWLDTQQPVEDPSSLKDILTNAESALERWLDLRWMDATAKIPVVLPLQVLRTASTTDLSSTMGPSQALFLLQLAYLFRFMEKNQSSPFCLDPRELPLAQIYTLCQRDSRIPEELSTELLLSIRRSAPEVLFQVDVLRAPVGRRLHGDMRSLLRSTMDGSMNDVSARLLEEEFAVARNTWNRADLYPLVVGAVLARKKAIPMVYSYSSLCRDPLVVLKASRTVWTRCGLRRILLSILDDLLVVNEKIVRSVSRSEDVTEDYLSSQGAIVVHSLLTTSESLCLGMCRSTMGIVRRLAVKYPGLVATLLRQDMDDKILDFLVMLAPETMRDAPHLSALLNERASTTAGHRLCMADGVLRIALTYGQKDQAAAENMVMLVMQQLVASFFLIIGPSGVPVSALIAEDGLDATQMSRQKAMRIIQACGRALGHSQGVRGELSLGLQKMLGLCRGESIVGSLPQAISSRQKKLLRDLSESIQRSSRAVGIGMG